MRVLHEGEPLATDVEVAEGFLAKARGLMGRRSVADDYALVFPFDRPARRSVHMLFVRTALDVLWLADGRVTRRSTLSPWIGVGRARADTIVELAPGATADVEVGDAVTVAESD